MAGRALLRGRLVEQDLLAVDDPCQRVALRAARFLVRPLERERGALIVIEQRRLPLRAVVARDATGNSVLRELLPMDIFVAVFALRRRCLEVDICQLRLQVRRLVAIRTSCSAMRPDQREIRLRVIEARQLFP